MFRGWGVGLTVTDLGGRSGPGTWAPDGVVSRPSRLSEVMPVEARSDAELAVELGRVQSLKAMLAAYEAELVVGLAAHRPEAAHADAYAEGRSPVPGASEFFVDELAVVTNASARAAQRSAAESWVLVQRLPLVWAALADGVLDWPRARVFIDVLGPTAVGVAEAVSAELLPGAVELSVGRLRRELGRAVLAADAASAEERRAEAEQQADVRLYPTADGMAEFAAGMPAPLAAACWSTVDELAWMVKHDGDTRPIGALRAGVLADLILRPWDTTRPAVTAQLTVTAPLAALSAGAADRSRPGGEAPDTASTAEVDGLPITAAHVRELLAQLDAVCPGGLQAPAGGSLQIAVTDPNGALRAITTRTELHRIARTGCPDHPDTNRPCIGHPGTGRPVIGSACRCPVLDAPPAVDRYRPSAAQRRFLEHRDRTCRQPNCGQPVGRTDMDHVTAYDDDGPTDCTNLCCLCRRHHRLKTHARGWRFQLTADGLLTVTSPSGVTRTTRPPGLCHRTDQPALPRPPLPPVTPEEPAPF